MVAAGSFAGCVILHLGLDYAAVEIVMRRFLPPEADPAAVLADVMVMEAEAMAILNRGDA